MNCRTLEADILVVGGGSAGCMAAIRALELNPELRIVIFEKGDIKYSGSIARGMDALNIVAIPNFTTPELYVESATLNCDGVLDAAPSYVLAKRSYELLKRLERWGVYFPTDANGNYRTLQYHPKGDFLVAMDEPNLKVIIARKALEMGARVINRVMAIELLLDEGRVAGVLGLDVRSGDSVVCRAQSVILSAGGQARFGLPNSGYLYGTFDYPGNSGDSYVMAVKAGARLSGMEYSRYSIVIKDVNIPLLAVAITRGGKVLDIFDSVLMEKSCHNQTSMAGAHLAGKGPVRIRLKHLPADTIAEIERILFTTERPITERFFSGRKIDFRKRDIELWPTECQLCGGHGMAGIVINERAETNVAGLYAAGDTANVAKGHLTGAFVFGEIAAESAVAYVQRTKPPAVDDSSICRFEAKKIGRSETAGKTIEIHDIEFKIRRLINDYVVSPKNAFKLSRWLEWCGVFKSEIENQVRVDSGHQLSKLYEIDHILECATLSAKASLARTESRWGLAHKRIDFPETDNTHWMCHLDIRKDRHSGEYVCEKRPIKGIEVMENL
jgi:succinate dehydrogenase/fumarate reductase flavoprotein subunit